MATPDPVTKLRLDKWLWYARIVKTRSLAQTLIKTGKVRVNATKVSSPSHTISIDDVLTVTLSRQVKVIEIAALAVRRGPAPEAQTLYKDLSPPVPKRVPLSKPARQAVREEGAGRPTKKERRELSRFRSGAGEEF